MTESMEDWQQQCEEEEEEVWLMNEVKSLHRPEASLFEKQFLVAKKPPTDILPCLTSILSLAGLAMMCLSTLRQLRKHRAFHNQSSDNESSLDPFSQPKKIKTTLPRPPPNHFFVYLFLQWTSSSRTPDSSSSGGGPTTTTTTTTTTIIQEAITEHDPPIPLWMSAPFYCTGLMATIQFLVEFILFFLLWEPYELSLNPPIASLSENLRNMMYSMVLNSTTFMTFCMTIHVEYVAFGISTTTTRTTTSQKGTYRYVTYIMMLLSGMTCIVSYYNLELWLPFYVVLSLTLQLYWTMEGRKKTTLFMLMIITLPWTLGTIRSLLFDNNNAPGPNEFVDLYPIRHVLFPLGVNIYLCIRFMIQPQFYSEKAMTMAVLFHLSASCITIMVSNYSSSSTTKAALNSTVYHSLLTAMIYCLYKACDFRLTEQPDYAKQVTEQIVMLDTDDDDGDDDNDNDDELQQQQQIRKHDFLKTKFKMIACFFLGCTILVRWFTPHTFYAFRSTVAYMIWSIMYLGLLHRPFLRASPYKLSTVYHDSYPTYFHLDSYTEQHDEFMPRPWNVQTVQLRKNDNGTIEYPKSFRVFQQAIDFVSAGFTIVTKTGQVLPLADIDIPIKYKPRLFKTENGQDKLPYRIFQSFPGFAMKEAKTFQPIPEPSIESYQDGRLFGHLCQYSIGNTFLKLAKESNTYPYYTLMDEIPTQNDTETTTTISSNIGLVVDFRHLEHYETKNDYYKYGGIAFLQIHDIADPFTGTEESKLDVIWVVGTQSRVRVYKNVYDGSYYRISHILVSSLYFEVIAGKHLTELHMKYELLWASLNNVFDVGLNNNNNVHHGGSLLFHPFRLIIYPHMFCSAMATELLVVHLVQQVAVFSQIFAMKYHSLLDYMTDISSNFVYASDEDWEYRTKVDSYFTYHEEKQQRTTTTTRTIEEVEEETEAYHRTTSSSRKNKMQKNLQFHSQFHWEQRYRKIWDTYATSMIDEIYENDDQVRNDPSLPRFNRTLSTVFHSVPNRYESFQTKRGLVRFLSDTIHHLVIRHYVYGTTIVESGALDARMNSPQIPKDMNPPAVGEYRAYAFILMATAYPFFCKLLEDQEKHGVSSSERSISNIFEDASYQAVGKRNEIKQGSRTLPYKMKKVFNTMQKELRALNDEWSFRGRGDPKSADPIYMYSVARPENLFTGPCN